MDATRLGFPPLMFDAVCCVPFASHPSYTQGYYDRDNQFYLEWDQIRKGLNPEAFNILTLREIEANPWKRLPGDAQKLEVNWK